MLINDETTLITMKLGKKGCTYSLIVYLND